MDTIHQYYDRRGQPLTFAAFCGLHTDPNYVLIAHTAAPAWQIFTTWTGMGVIDTPWATSHLFQTVFVRPDGQGGVIWYGTEPEALAGHAAVAGAALESVGDLESVAEYMGAFHERTFGP